jgi:TolB-like protein/DNA-binding winged helix-turn-helix (wHTH) protein
MLGLASFLNRVVNFAARKVPTQVAPTAQARQVHTRFAFGAFEIDLTAGELRKHGIRVRLQDQPFRILQALIERPGALVSREELQKQIWPADTFVDFDHGINNAIKRLREALSDSAEDPRYIETVPRRGYRFIAELSVANGRNVPASFEPQEEDRRAGSPERSRRWIKLFVGVATLIALGVVAFALRGLLRGSSGAARIQSLAVLPLANLSGDSSQDYFVDGMTDALTTELSQISSLKVISRTSALRYRRTEKSLPRIARELNVDAVVEGTVQRSADRIRITAQLIQGATDKHLWAQTYDRKIEDALSVQGEIARSIAGEIRAQITPEEKARMARSYPINMKAVEAYLQGTYHYEKAKEMTAHRGIAEKQKAELDQAMAFFQQAVTDDPSYARAYMGMGEILGVPAYFPYPPTSMAEPAREALRKALVIDPNLAEAYVDLGRIDYRGWKWPALEYEAKRAIEINPNLASAHNLYAAYLLSTGRLDEAMQEGERTQELDPGSDRVAWVFYCQRKFDRFVEFKRTDTARNAHGPMAHFDLGFGYERSHMQEEAVKEWEVAMTGFGFDELTEGLRRGFSSGGFKGAMTEWARGLETLAEQGEIVEPGLVAYIYSIQGQKDRAFAWLEKSMEMHSSAPPAFKVDPTYDELRSDPRYSELIRRVGLKP